MPSRAVRASTHRLLTLVPEPESQPESQLEPEPAAPRGEVCVLLDHDRAVVWLHGVIDGALAEDLAEAATDLEDAGLPVLIRTDAVTSWDATALALLARLMAAGLPVQVRGPEGPLTGALQQALLGTSDPASVPLLPSS